jgi:hypothetical protein
LQEAEDNAANSVYDNDDTQYIARWLGKSKKPLVRLQWKKYLIPSATEREYNVQ